MDTAVEVSVVSSQNQQQGTPRPFNQNHQNPRQFGHGSSSRGRGGNGDGFRNQNNNSHRRHHHHQPRGGFNYGNSNRQHGNNNARPVNLQYRPQGFVNGAPHFVDPQPPMPLYTPPPNLPFVENHHQYYNFPQLPARPQFPGFMAPPPMMYNGNPYYPEEHSGLYGAPMMPPMPYMDAMRGPPVGSVRPQPPAPVMQNLPDPEAALCSDLLRQINYYFSDENLVKDRYLKSKMDEQGWVSVHLIAEFRRVAKMTSNIDLILRALTPSWIVEIQGDKMRRRGDWMKYITPPSGLKEPSSEDMLIAGINNIRLDLRSEPEVEKVEFEE